jgi:hypothetical protein
VPWICLAGRVVLRHPDSPSHVPFLVICERREAEPRREKDVVSRLPPPLGISAHSLSSSQIASARPTARADTLTMVILGGLEIIAGGYLYHRYHKSKDEKRRLALEAQQGRHDSCRSHPPHPPHASPPQKYGYGAHTPLHHALHAPPPPPPPPPTPFLIPRRPLQRADSMATMSCMPVANGYRPSHALTPQTLRPVPHGGRPTVDDNWETYHSHALAHPHHAPSLSKALGEPSDDDPPPPYRC